MIEENNILGGVSPLKKRQASRGGKSAGRATATSSRRGGFAKSKGKRGAGGANVGGYNVQTRFKADKWTPPPSGGTTTIPFGKPFGYTPDGTKTVNPPQDTKKMSQTQDFNINVPGSPDVTIPGSKEEGYYENIYEMQTEDLEGYRKVWKDNANDLQGKYSGDYDKFVKEAEKWWAEEAEKAGMSVEEFKETYKKKKKVKTGERYVKTKDATEDQIIKGSDGINVKGSQTQTYG